MKNNYTAGGFGYGHAKTELLNFILSNYSDQREKFNYFMSNKNELDSILSSGAKKAKIVANEVLGRVRQKLGYN